MELEDLRQCSQAELEILYLETGTPTVPRGRFRGVHLHWLGNPTARRAGVRLLLTLGFKAPFYGIDFDSRCWFFGHPSLQMGRFEPRPGPSRWRDTNTVALIYEVSRLPAAVRAWLYDEVKPLSDRLCLGLGGINAPRDRGDLFFFALERLES